ncbi:MAG: DUF3016 domain-containing protein [Rubrivivax sp.]|nr:DUF3016 domain-containing protein [Rubrivivax sp.]
MRTHIHKALLALGLVASLGSAQAAGTVVLSWLDDANYADAGRNTVERERTLQTLGRHIQALGAQLPDGQVLKLEVLDLDLAGDARPWHGRYMDEVRVLGGMADWPQMKLRYNLQAGNQTLASGTASLSDMGYLFRQRVGVLAYEKHMVDAWFQQTFVASAGTR